MKRMIKKIPFKTKEEWLQIRKNYIGSSEVPIILGLSPFESAEHLFNRKLNGLEVAVNEAMEWGLILEDLIAKEYARRKGVRVYKPKFIFHNVYYPHLIASVDYLFKDADVILEIKNSRFFKNEIFGMPAYVYAQVQTQLLVSGKGKAIVVALVGGNDLREIELLPDSDMFEKIIVYTKAFKEAIDKKDYNIFKEFLSVNQDNSLTDMNNVQSDEISENEINKLIEIDKLIKELENEKSRIVDKIKNSYANMEDEKTTLYNKVLIQTN